MSTITLPGTDEVVGTDTVSGEKIPLGKILVGGAGAGTMVSAADPLPVADPDLMVSLGLVPTQETLMVKGMNNVITQNSTPEDIWNGGDVYTGFPTTAETLEVRSSSDDDAAAGTGARTLTVCCLLTQTGARSPDVTVNLDGQNWVSLGPIEYWRTAHAHVDTAGSAGHNVGEITIRHTTTTTNIFAVMPAMGNETAIAVYTVPLGYEAHINKVNIQLSRASGAAGSADCTFRAREVGGVFQSKLYPTAQTGGPYTYSGGYMVFPALSDIVVRVDSVSDNFSVLTSDYSGKLVAT